MLRKSRSEKLKKLVEDSYGSRVNPWISTVNVRDVVLDVGEKEEIRHWMRYGYMKREEDKPIDGFEFLLRNMDTIGVQTVLIHKVFDESGRLYRIFTDTEISGLIGVLRFPITKPSEPYSIRIKKLKNLIVDSYGSNENPWISKLEAEAAVIDVAEGDGILISSIRNIYSARGRRNQERGAPIEGFEYLLRNLDATRVQTVLIHKMTDAKGRDYYIFTDPDIKEFIGLLRFPIESFT